MRDNQLWEELMAKFKSGSTEECSVVVLSDGTVDLKELASLFPGAIIDSPSVACQFLLVTTTSERDDGKPIETMYHVWIIERPAYKDILKDILTEENIPHTALVFVTNMRDPITMMQSAEEWAIMINDHLYLTLWKDQQYKKHNNEERVNQYVLGVQMEKRRKAIVEEYQKQIKKKAMRVARRDVEIVGADGEELTEDQIIDQMLEEEFEGVPDIEKGVLTYNFGMPTIVCAHYSEVLKEKAAAEAERLAWQPEHMYNYLLANLRTFALSIGASLAFSSSRFGHSGFDNMFRYLRHRFFKTQNVRCIMRGPDTFIPFLQDSNELITQLPIHPEVSHDTHYRLALRGLTGEEGENKSRGWGVVSKTVRKMVISKAFATEKDKGQRERLLLTGDASKTADLRGDSPGLDLQRFLQQQRVFRERLTAVAMPSKPKAAVRVRDDSRKVSRMQASLTECMEAMRQDKGIQSKLIEQDMKYRARAKSRLSPRREAAMV